MSIQHFSGGAESVPFIDGNVITGRVIDADQNTQIATRGSKAARYLVEGQPWQFGHQTVTYTLTVEPLNPVDIGRERTLIFYGDILHQVKPGHIIRAKVSGSSGTLVVKSLDNLTTNTTVTPAFQIGGGKIARVLVLAVALIFIALLAFFVWTIASGSFLNTLTEAANDLLSWLGSLLITLGPILIMILIMLVAAREVIK